MSAQIPRIATERSVTPRRIIGRKVMAAIPSYKLNGDGAVSVTAARQYVRANRIKFPALISVVRTQFTTDHFFLSEKGMFSASYAEYNYFNFPSLMEVFRSLGLEGVTKDYDDLILMSPAVEFELYKPEYAFI